MCTVKIYWIVTVFVAVNVFLFTPFILEIMRRIEIFGQIQRNRKLLLLLP